MSGILQGLLASIGSAAAAVTDAYFNLVTLLLNTTSTNGAQNNTFLDSSTNNFTITRNGNTTQGTFTPFSQTGWSNYFDGTAGQYLNTPSNAVFSFGTGDFTVEAWVFVTGTSFCEIFTTTNTTPTSTSIRLLVTNAQKLQYSDQTNTVVSTGTISLNTWTHVAVSRSGTSVKLFINGTQDGSTTSSNNLTNQIGYIGRTWDGIIFTGYISNLRVTKGGALYTGTFTPSTTPLTTTVSSGTVSLLTCQSNRFLDNSSNAFAITVNGTPSVQALSPFLPTAAYDTAVVGGSGYFDGSGDWLTAPNNTAFDFGSGNFTIEAWYYPTVTSPNSGLFGKRANGSVYGPFVVEFASSLAPTFYFSTTGSSWNSITSSVSCLANSWNHIAATRSGSTFTIWINGVSGGTASTASALMTNTDAVSIGAVAADGTRSVTGYLSGSRLIKGTAQYTATFTPPTAPPTAVTNTTLLLNYTNGGIYDSAAKNVLETVGNAQVSTTQSKWGTTSMFLGSSGANKLFTTNIIPPQSGNFTLEMWIYPTSFVDFNTIFDSRTSDTDANGFVLGVNAAAKLYFYTNNAFALTATGTISANTWTHVALVRNGTGSGNIKIYINGTADATTATNTASFTRTSASIGDDWNTRSSLQYFGYADDIRISNFARYTANFTAPTAAFPLQ